MVGPSQCLQRCPLLTTWLLLSFYTRTVMGLVVQPELSNSESFHPAAIGRLSKEAPQDHSPLDQFGPSEELVLRLATPDDIPSLQKCNRALLPENYPDRFYSHYITTFPDLTVVAESTSLLHPEKSCIVAYALGCIVQKPYSSDDPTPPEYLTVAQKRQLELYHLGQHTRPQITHGHTISLAVNPSHRRMGLASMLLRYLHSNMRNRYGAVVCDLSVRVSNEGAIRLYEREGYCVSQRLLDYYKTGVQEDGFNMQKDLVASLTEGKKTPNEPLPRQLFVFRENTPLVAAVRKQPQQKQQQQHEARVL
eukprot:scaffold3086_cov75-Cylindrotheca_fusiformis.AAC.3